MSTKKLSNISVAKFRKFLKAFGLNLIKDTKGRGGHEKWSMLSLERQITIQIHIDPVPKYYCNSSIATIEFKSRRFFQNI